MSIVPPPGNNGGSRESSEFEFVGKNGNGSGSVNPLVTNTNPLATNINPLVTNSEYTATYSTLTNPIMHPSPHIVSLPTFPIMETEETATVSQTNQDKTGGSAAPAPRTSCPPLSTSSISSPVPTSRIEEEVIVKAIAEEPPSAPGMFGWVRGGGLLSRVVEKTKAVTENIVTTLDPQMKDFIHSGGDVQIVVASDKDEKVGAVREAFQNVFGHATIVGLPSRSTTIAEQPVGFASGRQAALERISSLRKCGSVQKDTVVVSVENFLYEVSENIWLDFSCLILSDPQRKIQLQSYSQPTNVSSDQIKILKDSTPSDYNKQWSGFAVPIGGIMAKELKVSPQQWQEAVSGISRRRLLLLAGEGMAGMYKRELKSKVEDV